MLLFRSRATRSGKGERRAARPEGFCGASTCGAAVGGRAIDELLKHRLLRLLAAVACALECYN